MVAQLDGCTGGQAHAELAELRPRRLLADLVHSAQHRVPLGAERDALVCYPPALAISDLLRRLEGASAGTMRTEHTGRCNRARMPGHFWTPSYFAASAGGAPLSTTKQHIENQTDRPDERFR